MRNLGRQQDVGVIKTLMLATGMRLWGKAVQFKNYRLSPYAQIQRRTLQDNFALGQPRVCVETAVR